MSAISAKQQSLADLIRHLAPCSQALEWLRGYDDPRTAWDECPRGDWMLWLIGHSIQSPPWSEERKPLLACALDCAETVRHLWPERQRAQIARAISWLRAWIDGCGTIEQSRQARRDLFAAGVGVVVAAADDASSAVSAAAEVAAADADDAYVACAVTCAANAAAHAVYAAVDDAAYGYAADADYVYAADAADAAAYAARKKILAECADIVRRHFPKPPEIQKP